MTSKRQKQKGWLLPEAITGHPLVCVQFQIPDAREYRAAVRGTLLKLTKSWNWEKSYQPGDMRARDVSRIFLELIDTTLEFNEECSGHNDQSGCIELPLDSPAIEWLPMDPFRNPDEIPSGYLLPPWYRQLPFPPSIIGALPGDVMTDPTRFALVPTFEPLAGFARFRLSLKGTGTVELHFVNVFLGGMAQVQVDGDVLQLSYVDLNRDDVGAPSETEEVVIIERTITEPGDHFIDVTMLPVVDDAVPPLRYGGGLRKIVLCGFDKTIECPDCPEPDCPDCPDDDCGGCEELLDRFDADDCEELEELMDCAMPFIGQVVAGIVPPTGGGWLKCDGTAIAKAVYPELYAILSGKVGEDDTTFNLPDFRDRIPMGAGEIVDVLAAAGESEHTLTVAEMPEHAHDAAAHSHTTEEHYHTTPNHTHSIDAHTHSIPSHTHNVTIPGHSHTIPGRNNSALGASGRFPVTNGTGTVNDTISTGSDGGGTFATTSGGSGTTGANSAGGITNSGGSGNTSAETVTVNAGGGGATSTQGQGEAFPILPPVLGVHWFIFAGCKEAC